MKKFLKTVGNYAGDYGRFLADNTLSTFGVTDVIKASDYKTKLGKATNKFTETVSPAVGAIAAGVIGGPMASKAMGQTQSGINNATSNQVDPMARQMQQNASAQNFLAQMQPIQAFTPTFKCGGSLKKMQDGGNVPYSKEFTEWWYTSPELSEWFASKYKDRGGDVYTNREEELTHTPRNIYDYEKAWKSGDRPQINPTDSLYHWGSSGKGVNHPTRWKQDYLDKYSVNPDTLPASQQDSIQQSMRKMQDGGSINRWVIDNTKMDGTNYTLPNGTVVPKAEFEKYMNVPINEQGAILPPLKGTKTDDYHPFRGIKLPPTGQLSEQFGVAPTNNMNTDFVRGYKYGGKLNSYNMGGKFEEYNGQSHQGPNEGIAVDQTGTPAATTGNEPVALVENNETRWQDYIFSDSIKVPNSKETFADKSKKVKKKYELRLGKDLNKFDPIDSAALETEMMALMGAQEALKTPEQTPMMKNGGKLPKYQGGGNTGYEARNQVTNPRTNLMTSLAGVNNITPMQNITPTGSTIQPMGTQQPNLYMIGNRPNTQMQRPAYSPTMGTAPVGAGMATKMSQGIPSQMSSLGASVAQNIPNSGLASKSIPEVAGDSTQTNQELYQGGINPLALAAPVAGNIVGMIGESRRRNVGLNLGRVAPQQINMESARAGLRNQAASARLANRAAMQQSGATAGNYMVGNLAGNVSTQRAAGEALANTYMGEQQFNAQARAQADAMNLQNQGQEAMFGAQQNLAGQGRMNQYRDAISTNVGQYFAEDQRSRQNAQLLGLMSDNYQYTQSGPWYNRRINKRLAETNATQRG